MECGSFITPMSLAHSVHPVRNRPKTSAETSGLDCVFPPDDLGSGPTTDFILVYITYYLNNAERGPQFRPYPSIPNVRSIPDDIFKRIFENENEWIPPRISLKFVPKVRINNIPALVQTMAWRRPGDKPLSEPMMVSLLTHICVTRPQWVKIYLD